MSVIPDMIFGMGGVPVGQSPQFAGFWGGQNIFVDYDNGVASNTGTQPYDACKYLDTAIAKANAWATIYVRPRIPDYAGGDPNGFAPKAAANLVTTATQYGLSIIGTGTGRGPRSSGYITTIQGSATVTNTPVLKILGPYTDIENLHIKKGSVTAQPLVLFSGTPFGSVLYNCKLNQGDGTTYGIGSVCVDSAWYVTIANNLFDRCALGVSTAATTADVQGLEIAGNEFSGVGGASSYGDIVIFAGSAGVLRTIIRDNIFDHAIPSAGYAKYIYSVAAGGTNTGIVANNFFATATTALTSLMTLTGELEAGSMRQKGFLT